MKKQISGLHLLLVLIIAVFSVNTMAAKDNGGGDQADAAGGRFIYTESNSLGGNFVLGYRLADDGTFTQLPSSPFPTNGAGDGIKAPNGDSDHGMARYGRFILVSNRASNTIDVFKIHRDGSLTLVEGSPFSVGVTPVSIAIHGDLVFVLDFGKGVPTLCDGCAYRGYRINEEGQLIEIPSAVVELAVDPSPVPFSIHFSPNGRFLIGTELFDSHINVFRVERGDGPLNVHLSPVAGSPFSTVGNQPFGIVFNPVDPSQFFVANTETTHFPFDRAGDVTSYSLDQDGTVTPLVSAPAPAGDQKAPCWVIMTSDGKFLYTTNTASSSVTSFSVAPDGQLTLIGVTPIPRNGLPATGVVGPTDPVITPDDQFLYVSTLGIATVTGFRIGADGLLTPVQDPVRITIPNAIPMGMIFVDTTDDDQI